MFKLWWFKSSEWLWVLVKQGIGADFARAYLSNVCVAEELQRNGLGYALVAKSKIVAQQWGKIQSSLIITVRWSFPIRYVTIQLHNYGS